MREIALGDTSNFKFTTRQFSSGAPFALASGTVVAYPGSSTTEITAGITLSANFDSRTGLNNVEVVATSGNGYAADTEYTLVLSVGTVDSVSVVGEVVGEFRTTGVPATAGDQMDLVSAPNSTAVTAIQNGLSTLTAANVRTAVGLGSANLDTQLGTLATGASITSLQSHGDSNWGTATGFSTLTQADIRTAVGLGSANLDTQLGATATQAKMLAYFQLALRGDTAANTDLTTELGEINTNIATGPGSYDNQTDASQALRDRGDAAWITASGFSTLDAAGIRTAVGLTTANLDTQLSALSTLDAAGVRTAIGMTSANLDTQLGTLSTLDAPGVRTAVGLATANLDTQFSDLTTLVDALPSTSDVKAQVVAALSSDTYAEPGQGLPPATATLAYKIGMLYKGQINLSVMDSGSGLFELYNNGGSVVDHKASITDAAGVFTRNGLVSGP